ncbi:hypothetical protein MBLNU13_g11711t2 [Cladosporium sp. NU13]
MVFFAYYHSHGDGKSGLAFHRSFLEGLQDKAAVKQASDMFTSRRQTSMKEAGKLSLSWSPMLAPLLGVYLPVFLANMFGFRASATPPDDSIWCGKDFCFDPNDFPLQIQTNLIHRPFEPADRQSTKRDPEHAWKTFAPQIVVDLRRLFQHHRRPSEMRWDPAHQPFGLLQYQENFRGWTLRQIGKKRGSSCEISNLVVYDPVLHHSATEKPKVFPDPIRIEKTFFAQPAAAVGPCLNFNLVTTKGGPLVTTATWQQGVLDLGDVEQEATFVREVGLLAY